MGWPNIYLHGDGLEGWEQSSSFVSWPDASGSGVDDLDARAREIPCMVTSDYAARLSRWILD